MTYILCTDLDRTLIANGTHANDQHALPALQSLLAKTSLKLVYVSGRDINLVDQAIEQYQLPIPDFAITDVGCQIYQRNNTLWQQNLDWHNALENTWDMHKIEKIKNNLSSLSNVSLQEPDRQSIFKLSYYFSTKLDTTELNNKLVRIVEHANLHVNIVMSIDETTNTGLIDFIPKNASKNLAIQFLVEQESFDTTKLVYSGDSGNDMSVFSSRFNTILVNNAEPYVKELAITIAKQNNLTDTVYIAHGDYFNLTGNYCAGILEGMAYYFPELKTIIQEQLDNAKAS